MAIGVRVEPELEQQLDQLARSMGVWAEGPVTAPGDLGSALKRAVQVVKGGRPALVDVVSEPR